MIFNNNDDFRNPWDNKKNNSGSLEDIISEGKDKIIDFLGHKKKSGGSGSGRKDDGNNTTPFKNIIVVISIIFLLGWLSTGFYTIQPAEEGVVMRFGKYSRLSTPGLNYKMPTPIETVTILSVTTVNREEVGFRSTASDRNPNSNSSISLRRNANRTNNSSARDLVMQESQMLTGDENIIDINFDVQWVINDSKKFLFNVRDLVAENTVKSAAESAVREVVGIVNITDVLAEERSRVENEAKTKLQEILDEYDMGVQVLRLQLLKVEPPAEVLDAYRDVQSSKADREKEINQAFAFRNEIVPKARGEGQKMILDAEAYKQFKVETSAGEAERFNLILEQYSKAKDVTRKRMYLETMEEILAGMNKVIIDKNVGSGVVPFLPLDKLQSNKNSANAAKMINSNENEG